MCAKCFEILKLSKRDEESDDGTLLRMCDEPCRTHNSAGEIVFVALLNYVDVILMYVCSDILLIVCTLCLHFGISNKDKFKKKKMCGETTPVLINVNATSNFNLAANSTRLLLLSLPPRPPLHPPSLSVSVTAVWSSQHGR